MAQTLMRRLPTNWGNEIMELYSGCDVEIYSGGQPIYYYVISVE